MDGIAIHFDRFEQGQRQFPIDFVQAAGAPQQKLINVKNCCEVMTGAMLPEEADTVVKYEDVEIENDKATIQHVAIRKGDNIHRQGSDAKATEILLPIGLKISSAEIPVLASVGKSTVLVKSLPKVAIISTGDELVDILFQ